MLCVAFSSALFFNSCKDDDSEDTSSDPWVDPTHQQHSSDGYSVLFPTGLFGQYHHDREQDLLDSDGVEWNNTMNVFCLKSDSTSNITIASTKNKVSADLIAKHDAFETEIIAYNYGEPVSEDAYFSALEKHVSGHVYRIEGIREMKFYYLFNPLNNRGYRIIVQAPLSNDELWEYVPEILSNFRFTED